MTAFLEFPVFPHSPITKPRWGQIAGPQHSAGTAGRGFLWMWFFVKYSLGGWASTGCQRVSEREYQFYWCYIKSKLMSSIINRAKKRRPTASRAWRVAMSSANRWFSAAWQSGQSGLSSGVEPAPAVESKTMGNPRLFPKAAGSLGVAETSTLLLEVREAVNLLNG